MIDIGSDREHQFFITGAKTYIDVHEAMEEFRRQAQVRCATVVNGRFDELKAACKTNWARSGVKDYTWRPPDGFHFGKKILVKELGDQGGLYFCLELLRENDGVDYSAVVYLNRGRANLAVELWARLAGSASDTAFAKGNDLIFFRPFTDEGILNFQERLSGAIDEFVAFISAAGGLKRYL